MPVTVPESPTFLDVEDIICDFVDEKLKDVTPKIRAWTYLPDFTKSDLDDGKSFVLVQRVGGIADYSGRAVIDNAIVELTVLAPTRQDSRLIFLHLRQKFYELASGGHISGHRISSVNETTGPAEVTFADPTQRGVKFLFQIGIQRATR